MHKGNIHPIARFQRLPAGRRELLLQATLLLAVASAAVALLPFRRAVRVGAVPLTSHQGRPVEDCVWAIEAAARRLPFRTMCIEKGIALQRMLRRSGRDARLHYGGRHDRPTGALEAHVWVSLDGQMLIGGEEAGDFTELACFPPAD